MADPQTPVLNPDPSKGRVGFRDRWAAWRASLSGPRVRGLLWQPAPYFPGSIARGRQVLAGTWRVGGHVLEIGPDGPWAHPAPNEAVQDALHGFDWLDDLAALPETEGRETGQAWVAGWLAVYGRGRGPGWAVDLVARRQMRMITYALFLMNGQAPADRARYFGVLGRQSGVLLARWPHTTPGLPRFEALAALVYSACALTGLETVLPGALSALAEECTSQIDPTGGIVSRNPEHLLEVFALLTWVAAILKDSGKPRDPAVDAAVARIAPTLRNLRHADGSLVRMHGGGKGFAGRLDQALHASGVRPARVKGLAMGYARMGGRSASLIVDAAKPMIGEGSHEAHASTLAFELVSGRYPVIVSCGNGKQFGPNWRRAGRATASHSTLSLNSYASSRLARGALDVEPDRQNLAQGPETVDLQEAEMKTADGLVASHDGWRKTHGLVHLRSLQFDHDGGLLRGEDGLAAMTEADREILDRVLLRLPGDVGLRLAVRFHLHPDALAEIDMGGNAVSITLPDKETWVFRYAGDAKLSLEKSFYLDSDRLSPRATKQIVLSGALTGYGSAVSWTLARPVGLLQAPDLGARPDD